MKATVTLHTKFGTFESEQFDLKRDEYNKLVEDSKTFYQGTYGMDIINGHIVFPPEIVKESILEINIKKKYVAE